MPFRYIPPPGGDEECEDCPDLALNFPHNVKPAIKVSAVLRATLSEPKVGVKVEQAPATLLVPSRPGFSVVTRGEGVAAKPEHRPAPQIVQVTYNLTRFVPGDTAAEIGIGGVWANVGNANGEPGGAPYATLSEGAALSTGRLRLHFPDSVGKDELTITAVEFLAYFRITGAAVGTILDLRARHGDAGTDVTVQQFSNLNADHLSSPYTEAVTTTLFSPALAMPALSWATVDDLQFIFDGSIAVSATTTPLFEVDAVKLRVTANRTDTL